MKPSHLTDHDDGEAARSDEIDSTHVRGARPNILLAHAVPETRKWLESHLRAENYRFTSCENGSQALRAALEGNYRLLIAAVVMPDMDGLELLATWRRHQPGLRSILLAQGNTDIDSVYLRCARLLGADVGLAHPFEVEEFLGCVRRLLETRSWISGNDRQHERCDSV